MSVETVNLAREQRDLLGGARRPVSTSFRWQTARVGVVLLAQLSHTEWRSMVTAGECVGVGPSMARTLMRPFSRAGIVETGCKRGSRLARDPADIRLADAFGAFDAVDLAGCHGRHWTDASFAALDAALVAVLADWSLADLQRAMGRAA